MQVASGFETIRDINVASHLIGDVFGSTLDDPLSECYKKLGCSINSVPEDSEDYKMIVKYLEKTYEPVKVDDVVRRHTAMPLAFLHPLLVLPYDLLSCRSMACRWIGYMLLNPVHFLLMMK